MTSPCTLVTMATACDVAGITVYGADALVLSTTPVPRVLRQGAWYEACDWLGVFV